MRKQILVVGDCNLDLIIHGAPGFPEMGKETFVEDMFLRVGGSAANVAMSLGRLGVPVTLLTGMPTDFLAGYVRQTMDRAGVTLAAAPSGSQKTGISVSLSDGEDRAFLSYRGSNEALDFGAVDAAWLGGFSHVHLSAFDPQQLLSQYIQLAERARAAGCTVSLDLGWTEELTQCPELWTLLKEADVFFPNRHEAGQLTGRTESEAAAADLLEWVRDIVVITDGSRGARSYGRGESNFCLYPVEAVDAVGAGDAFDAGFLMGYVDGAPLKRCTQYGAACGSLVAERVGGGISGPTMQELEAFLQERDGGKTE